MLSAGFYAQPAQRCKGKATSKRKTSPSPDQISAAPDAALKELRQGVIDMPRVHRQGVNDMPRVQKRVYLSRGLETNS